jgi:hypothetical protein
MKRFALVGVGMAAGFTAAVMLFPSAHGANDPSAYRQLNLFEDAFERVRVNYVRPVDDNELVSSAIQGMVSSLDPHSSYMDAKAFADMQIQTSGQFAGLGHRSHDGRRSRQSYFADRRYAGCKSRHQDGRLHRCRRRHADPGHGARRCDRQDAWSGRHEGHAHRAAHRYERSPSM